VDLVIDPTWQQMKTRSINEFLTPSRGNVMADFRDFFPSNQEVFLAKFTFIDQLGILY
jgi:hypothetical protein